MFAILIVSVSELENPLRNLLQVHHRGLYVLGKVEVLQLHYLTG